MSSPLPSDLHDQAVRLYAAQASVTTIAARIGRPLHQVKQAVGWTPGRRKGTS